MTTLLIHGEHRPLTINFPAIAPMPRQQFYEFCLANRDLCIEQTATGEVIVMPPPFSDIGNRSGKIFQQLANWADQDGMGWLIDLKKRTVHIYRPQQAPEILETPKTVSGNPELPGFTLQMAKIW